MTSRMRMYLSCTRLCLLALLVTAGGIVLAGCGSGSSGDSGTNTRNSNIQGIWTGTTASNSGGSARNIELEFFQSGTDLTGPARSSKDGITQVGSITGPVNGTSINFSVKVPGSGSTALMGTVNGTTITGTYVNTPISGASESGTFTLSKSVGLVTENISGNYTGSGTSSGGNVPLVYLVSQNQNTLTYSGTLNTTVQFVGSGTIIGNRIIAQFTLTGTTDNINIIANYNANKITGNYSQSITNLGNNGLSKSGAFMVTEGT